MNIDYYILQSIALLLAEPAGNQIYRRELKLLFDKLEKLSRLDNENKLI